MENEEPSVELTLKNIILDIQKISRSCRERLNDLSPPSQPLCSDTDKARKQKEKFETLMSEVEIYHKAFYNQLRNEDDYGEPIKKLLLVLQHLLGN